MQVREVELESGGRQPYGKCRISASAVKIGGGRVAEMNETMKCDLTKDRDMEAQFAEGIADGASSFFQKFMRECEKKA